MNNINCVPLSEEELEARHGHFTNTPTVNFFLSQIRIPEDNTIERNHIFTNVIDKYMKFDIGKNKNYSVKNIKVDVGLFKGDDLDFDDVTFKEFFENEIGSLKFEISDCNIYNNYVEINEFEIKLGENIFPADIYITLLLENRFRIRFNDMKKHCEMYNNIVLRITYDMFTIGKLYNADNIGNQIIRYKDDKSGMSVLYCDTNTSIYGSVKKYIKDIHFGINTNKNNEIQNNIFNYELDGLKIARFVTQQENINDIEYLVKYTNTLNGVESLKEDVIDVYDFNYEDNTVKFACNILFRCDTLYDLYLVLDEFEYDINDIDVCIKFRKYNENVEVIHNIDIVMEDNMIKILNYTNNNVIYAGYSSTIHITIKNVNITNLFHKVKLRYIGQSFNPDTRRKLCKTPESYNFIMNFEHDK